MTEFTGERVIPGEVNDDLWAEHFARYAFAKRYASGVRVLDIGCGSGYGTAELSQQARVGTGMDVSADAIHYARTNYPLPNLHYISASATALPFPDASFELVVAFEVIEHLTDWRMLLSEARRVLDRRGIFLVSTPNKLYYAESRAERGPNPYHRHEFEFLEFRDALAEFFPKLAILLQNRVESLAFYPPSSFLPIDARLDGTRGTPSDAHFFVGICAIDRAPDARSFLYVPRAANILREREQHVLLLQEELGKTKAWLQTAIADQQKLLASHDELRLHLEEHNRWALQLEKDWKASLERITQLQDLIQTEQTAATGIIAAYERKLEELEAENRAKTQWAIETETRLSTALTAKCEELQATVLLLDTAEATVIERTLWAQGLEHRVQQLEGKLSMIAESRWLKLGRAVGLGPRVQG